jgi:peptidoglycan-associated lipoprotein
MPGGDAEPSPEAAREAFLNVDVLFAYNSFTLSEEAKPLLEQKAQWMAQSPGVTVQLEGHCDERGTVAYNLALGERRANVVRQYMTALGISEDRMTTISYGEEFPLDPLHNDEAWARNRRVHFVLLNP